MFPFCLKEFLTWQNYDNVIYQKNLRGSKASLHQFFFFLFLFSSGRCSRRCWNSLASYIIVVTICNKRKMTLLPFPALFLPSEQDVNISWVTVIMEEINVPIKLKHTSCFILHLVILFRIIFLMIEEDMYICNTYIFS